MKGLTGSVRHACTVVGWGMRVKAVGLRLGVE